MTPGYDHLYLLAQSSSFIGTVDLSMSAVLGFDGDMQEALTLAADCIGSTRWGVEVAVSGAGIIVKVKGARGFQPAAMLITPMAAQEDSPSAQFVRRSSHYLLQIFEANADDTHLAYGSPPLAHWVKTEGRVLLG